MVEQLDPKELVTIEEVAVSNMWEITALVEVLERKGDEETYGTIRRLDVSDSLIGHPASLC